MAYKSADGRQSTESYKHPDPVLDEALDWFLRLQDDHSTETLAEFDRWESKSPERHKAFDDLVRMQAMPSLHKATLADRSRHTKSCRTPLHQARARRATPRLLGSVAVAVTLAAAIIWQQLPGLMVQWKADYITTTGERETVSLPDGSSVILNTASAIAIDFEDGRRHVSLIEGEAYFDVKHDPAHPFVVAANFSEVEVKGTAFSVLADERADTVVLERGRVEVTRLAHREEKTTLEPGEMITASKEGLSPVSGVDVFQSLAWKDGSIIFRDRAFGEALSDLERYYRGKVVVVSNRFSEKHVNGNYRVDEPEAAIRTLAASVGADLTRLPGGILILR